MLASLYIKILLVYIKTNHQQNKFPQTERQLDGNADGEGEPDVLRHLTVIR